MKVTEQQLEVGGLQWFYREGLPVQERGLPPVLLLHGIPSQSYSWREVLPVLTAQGMRAIAPDWIGSGFSSKPEPRDFGHYTPDAYLSALADFVDALALDRFSLVVQGFVGSVGLQYALRHRERIERLAIFNTPLTTAVRLPWKLKQLGLPFIGDMLTQDPLLIDRTLEGGGFYRVPDEALDVYRRPYLKTSAVGRALLATVRNLQLPTVLAEIETGFQTWEQPTLVAWGMADPWLPFSVAAQFARAVPQTEVVKLEQVGHYPQEDWHEKVTQVLIPFLCRQAG
ncbi:alpha/beta fold hydrolase [Trichothermofontia sichuanensis B231]|uniref:alpha/beta fold hydrolase n=1 Tax=Trichothermofontia sichuanensis TaxID=3045816 RepID=UPI0022481B01|nr:alpha/beta fold hydrolase [Trichothermofontia sichuanensis]UZQ56402.1 alpha/beta fold hydrolase [Trichothermofontia sichuanensis B231]